MMLSSVLYGGIAAARIFMHEDFHDSRMQRILGIGRCRTALDIMHIAFIDNQRTLKLPHPLRVDTEIGLQQFFSFTFRYIDKASSSTQLFKAANLLSVYSASLPKYFLKQIRMLL